MRLVLFVVFVAPSCATRGAFEEGQPPDGGPWACPPDPPALGTPCPPPLSCEYGDAGPCSRYFQCSGASELDFAWRPATTDCPKVPACTQTILDAASACQRDTVYGCETEGHFCGCVNCFDDGGRLVDRELVCKPYAAFDCPSIRPLFGTPCAAEGRVCDYRQCIAGVTGGPGPPARCLGGLWIAQEGIACAELTCE